MSNARRYRLMGHPLTQRVFMLLVTFHISFFAFNCFAQRSRFDSIQHVDEVVVMSRYNHKEVIPSQTLAGKQLEKLSSNSVADALRYFSGIQLKDYGVILYLNILLTLNIELLLGPKIISFGIFLSKLLFIFKASA